MAFLLEPQDNVRKQSEIGLTGPDSSAPKPFHPMKRASETDTTFIDEKHTKCLKCGSRHDHPGALGSPLRLYGHGQQYDLTRSCRLSGFLVTADFYTRDFSTTIWYPAVNIGRVIYASPQLSYETIRRSSNPAKMKSASI